MASPKKKFSRDKGSPRHREIVEAYAEAAQRTRIPLNAITPREIDSRPLDPRHVDRLAESIEILGLIGPLTIDSERRLLAGGHRLAALQTLEARAPDRFAALFSEGVPVYQLAVTAEETPDLALQRLLVEIEENTQRQRYSAEEIRAAAERLKAAGYEELRGRPRAGQRSLKRELARVFNLSSRQLQRLLNPATPEDEREAPQRAFSRGGKRLRRALGQFQELLARDLEALGLDAKTSATLERHLSSLDLILSDLEAKSTSAEEERPTARQR